MKPPLTGLDMLRQMLSFAGDEGTYLHKCKCGAIWEHGDNCAYANDESTFDKSHTCPKCGKTVTVKYFGDDKPEFRGDCATPETSLAKKLT